MPDQTIFHWAGKVPRKDIQRLYASDASGLLDEDLLDRVLFLIYARVRDMFEVREAQTFGRVACRSCGAIVPQSFWMGAANRGRELVCDQCGWQTTCGDYLASYSGKDLLPGSRADLFQDFLDRFPTAHRPQEKMLLLDRLIHSFHVQSGVSNRLVAMNVIQGSRAQLIELLTNLAASDTAQASRKAWLEEEHSPIVRFRSKAGSHARVQEIAARLGIQGRTRMPENELISEILRLAPELGEDE